eukprot:m.54249 g.54249  ORF g.54249 m.54249 type:complete len:95 (+) comp16757_c1_seq1:110-394(+)
MEPRVPPKEVARAHAEHEIAMITREERIQETLMGELKGLPVGRSIYAASVGTGGGPGKVLFLTERVKAVSATQAKLNVLSQAKEEQLEYLAPTR